MIKEIKALKKFDLNNIDKSKWKSFPFEKIAFRIAETVDPNTTDLEIYYGLEHLDVESVHIRRNGTPSDVSGGKLKCYPGDIIFGKRRAYQRKAGIVKEAGICSAHSFVFRANENIIDSRLFPFFLHSDQFMHKMIDISVGGLSPTINWADLKHQEFLLPPKEQQAKLADLLWAMDEVIEKDLFLMKSLRNIYNLTISKELITKENSFDFKFKDNLKVIRGVSFKPDQLKDNGILILRSNNIQNFKINYLDNIFLPENIVDSSKLIFENDFAICMSNGSKDLVGKAAIIKNLNNYKVAVGAFCAGLKVDKPFISLVKHILNSKEYRTKISQILSGSTINNLKPSDVEGLEFKVSINSNYIIRKLNSILFNSELVESKIQSSKTLQKSLINQIF